MAQPGHGTVTHWAGKETRLVHTYLLQNGHTETEQSVHLLGIWHKCDVQSAGTWHTVSILIGWHTANTVDITLGFFLLVLSLTAKLLHSP